MLIIYGIEYGENCCGLLDRYQCEPFCKAYNNGEVKKTESLFV